MKPLFGRGPTRWNLNPVQVQILVGVEANKDDRFEADRYVLNDILLNFRVHIHHQLHSSLVIARAVIVYVAIFVDFNDDVVSANVGDQIWSAPGSPPFDTFVSDPLELREGFHNMVRYIRFFCLVVADDGDLWMLMNDTPKAVAAILGVPRHIAHFCLAESTASTLIAPHFSSFVLAIIAVAAVVAVDLRHLVFAMGSASVFVVKMDAEAVDVFGLESA